MSPAGQSDDRRVVPKIHLLAKGERCLNRLAMLRRAELESLRNTFRVARITAFNNDGADRIDRLGRR